MSTPVRKFETRDGTFLSFSHILFALGDGRACGFVDGFDGEHVFEAFFAGSLRFLIVADAGGELVRLDGELDGTVFQVGL